MDSAIWLSAALVFALGVRHAFEPDHLVTLLNLNPRSSAPWGSALAYSASHAATIAVLGVALHYLAGTLPVWLGEIAEAVAALVIVILCIFSLADVLRGQNRAGHAWVLNGWRLAASSSIGIVQGLAALSPTQVAMFGLGLGNPEVYILLLMAFAVGLLAATLLLAGSRRMASIPIGMRPRIRAAFAVYGIYVGFSLLNGT